MTACASIPFTGSEAKLRLICLARLFVWGKTEFDAVTGHSFVWWAAAAVPYLPVTEKPGTTLHGL